MSPRKPQVDETRRRRNRADDTYQQARFLFGFVVPFLFLMMMIESVGCIRILPLKFVSNTTGRTDYAVVGDTIVLSCDHLMNDDLEDIKELHWSLDGMTFAKWNKRVFKMRKMVGIEIYDHRFKGHLDNLSTHLRLIIHNVTMDMHGKYRCAARTDIDVGVNELDLVVITATPCKQEDWRFRKKQLECREYIQFDCRHMFPKPRPSCGLFDAKTDKLIRGVHIDIDEEPSTINSTRTYRVGFANKFDLIEPDGSPSKSDPDLIHFAGRLVFKCDIFVADTSWKLSVSHKMFDFSDGCEEDPLEAIEKMRANYNHYVHQRLKQRDSNTTLDDQNKIQTRPNNKEYWRKVVDDRNSLGSDFNYEILLPSQVKKLSRQNRFGGPGEHELDVHSTFSAETVLSNKNGHNYINEDMNCWRKPRIGTIIKLSCAAGPRKVRFMGSNLIECTANGWNLIRESNLINNEVLDSKTYKTPISRRRKLAWQSVPNSTSQPTKTPTTTTTKETTAGSNANQRDLTKNTTHSGPVFIVVDDDDNSSYAVPMQTTEMPMNEQESSTIAILASSTVDTDLRKENEAATDGDDFVIDILEKSRNQSKREHSPDQLVDLLPSCVPIAQKRRNYGQKPASEIVGAVMQGSTDGGRDHYPQRSHDRKWFTVVNNGADSSRWPLTTVSCYKQQASVVVIIYCVVLMVNSLLPLVIKLDQSTIQSRQQQRLACA